MIIASRAVGPLRILLVLLFAILVLFQTMSLPGQFSHMAAESPDLAHLRWPLTAVFAFWILCIQVVVLATWRLLGMVAADRIFTPASLRWVDVILGAIVAFWVVLLAVFLLVGFTADDPGVPMLLFLIVTVVAVAALLMVVMRALLRQATGLRSDLEAVI